MGKNRFFNKWFWDNRISTRKKIKLDPAVMASPFITTLVDAVSLLIYFTIASAMLSSI